MRAFRVSEQLIGRALGITPPDMEKELGFWGTKGLSNILRRALCGSLRDLEKIGTAESVTPLTISREYLVGLDA